MPRPAGRDRGLHTLERLVSARDELLEIAGSPVEEVLDEDDLENFFVEPIPNPLNPDARPDGAE